MQSRRGLFGFLAGAPLGAVVAIASAKQPTELTMDKIHFGAFTIKDASDGVNHKLQITSDTSDIPYFAISKRKTT